MKPAAVTSRKHKGAPYTLPRKWLSWKDSSSHSFIAHKSSGAASRFSALDSSNRTVNKIEMIFFFSGKVIKSQLQHRVTGEIIRPIPICKDLG